MKETAQHYVNNKQFSNAVFDYVSLVNKQKKADEPTLTIPEYIGDCILRIANGLSHKPNFSCYTYREEMVMDAVENCIKAIRNYDVTKKTRTGAPNAFAYFTQICYFAFLRRIEKEKKQQNIKLLYMEHAGINSFANFDDDDNHGESIVERIRSRTDHVKQTSGAPILKKTKRFGKSKVNSTLTEHFAC